MADAATHTVANPVDTVSALPGAVAAAPRVAWYLIRYGVDTVDDGLEFAVHPGRLVDALTLLGDEDNRAVNDVSSVTKLLLSQQFSDRLVGRARHRQGHRLVLAPFAARR